MKRRLPKAERIARHAGIAAVLPMRRCHGCGKRYQPLTWTQYHCSETCAVECVQKGMTP